MPNKKEASGDQPETPKTSKEIVTQDKQLANDYDIDQFLNKRKEFITKVNSIMVEKKDYHIIQGKKSLAKGGAEKIASIFNWQATFSRDTESVEMFGNTAGLIAFVCNLTKNGEYVGQGRGAAILSKNGGDPNKTLKMAQKSAFIDAVLRSSGLSDFFTQDLEDMPEFRSTTPIINIPEVMDKPKPKLRGMKPAETAFELWLNAVERATSLATLSNISKEINLVQKNMTPKEVEDLRKAWSNKVAELRTSKNESNDSTLL